MELHFATVFIHIREHILTNIIQFSWIKCNFIFETQELEKPLQLHLLQNKLYF